MGSDSFAPPYHSRISSTSYTGETVASEKEEEGSSRLGKEPFLERELD
jgi:hypothetical protein